VSTLPTVASAVATYSTPATYSTAAKSFSSSPRQSQQTDKSFPYWSIPMAGFGIILAVIVMYFVRKHRRRKKFKRTLAMHPSYPQDYAENASEFEGTAVKNITESRQWAFSSDANTPIWKWRGCSSYLLGATICDLVPLQFSEYLLTGRSREKNDRESEG